MSSDKDKYDEDSGDEGGTGSQGGKIDFVDFTDSWSTKRDDQLSEKEKLDKRHLAITHPEVHESKVKQQKEKLEQNKNKKEGNAARNTYGMGSGGGGGDWKYKENPALANFGKGVDIKVTSLPNENVAETNQAQRDELQNELRLRLGQQPKFNPKPSGPF